MENSKAITEEFILQKFLSACEAENIQLVLELLQNNTDLTVNNITLIIEKAYKQGNIEIIKLFLQDFNNSLSFLYRIMCAAGYGFTDILASLLKHPISDDFMAKDDDIHIVILVASIKKKIEGLMLLLKDHRISPYNMNKAFIPASEEGLVEIVELLLADKRIDPSSQDDLAIIRAAKNNHAAIIKLLLADERINPATQDNKPVMVAAKRNNIDAFRLLISNKRVEQILDYTSLAKNFLANKQYVLYDLLESHISVKKSLLCAYWASKQYSDENSLSTLPRKIIDEAILGKYFNANFGL